MRVDARLANRLMAQLGDSNALARRAAREHLGSLSRLDIQALGHPPAAFTRDALAALALLDRDAQTFGHCWLDVGSSPPIAKQIPVRQIGRETITAPPPKAKTPCEAMLPSEPSAEGREILSTSLWMALRKTRQLTPSQLAMIDGLPTDPHLHPADYIRLDDGVYCQPAPCTSEVRLQGMAVLQALAHRNCLALAPLAAAVAWRLQADDDDQVRAAAAVTLSMLPSSALATYASVLAVACNDFVWTVRKAAIEALATLPSRLLALHAGSTLARACQEDADFGVRRAAIDALCKLDSSSLASHVPVLAASMSDSDWYVRAAAAGSCARLDSSSLAPHATAVSRCLNDAEWTCRAKAVRALAVLEPSALAPYATALARLLDDEYIDPRGGRPVREAAARAMGRLNCHDLMRQARYLARRLDDTDKEVRCAAAEAMASLEPVALIPFAPLLANCLADSSSVVRCCSIRTMGLLPPSTLESYASALAAKCDDRVWTVRKAAVEALGTLPPPLLASLATALDALVCRLRDDEWQVRQAAASVIGDIDPAVDEQL